MLHLDLLKLLQAIKEIIVYCTSDASPDLKELRSATFFHNGIAETEKLLLLMTAQTS